MVKNQIWYGLRVGSFNLKYTPIKEVEDIEYPDVDINKNPLTRVKGKLEKGYWVNPAGERVEKAYKLIDDKLVNKKEKTKEIDDFGECSLEDVNNLMKVKYYRVDLDRDGLRLKQELEDSEKALTFGFCSGNTYQEYTAVITIFKGYLVMYLGRGILTNQIEEIESRAETKKKTEQALEVVPRAIVGRGLFAK